MPILKKGFLPPKKIMSAVRAVLIGVQAILPIILIVAGGLLWKDLAQVKALKAQGKDGGNSNLAWALVIVAALATIAYTLWVNLTNDWKDELSLIAWDNRNVFEVKKDGSAETTAVTKEVADIAANKVNTYQRPYQISMLKDPENWDKDNAFLIALTEAHKEKKGEGTIRFRESVEPPPP